MSYHTSLSEKLKTGFSNFADTLYGTGPEAYMKGGLYRSRIGANEALTRHRGLQSRDLETAYGRKNTLVEQLKAAAGAEGAPPEAGMSYNSILSGQPHSTWMRGAVTGADYGTKVDALQRLRETQGMDPNFVNMLEGGVTTPALTSGRLQRNPLALEQLKQTLSQGKEMHQQQLGTEAGRGNLLNAQTDNAIMSLNLTEERLAGLTEKNVNDKKIAEQNFTNAVALGNERQAATELAILNQQLIGNKIDRQDAVSEEYTRIMDEWKADPNTPLTPYESYIVNSGIGGSKVTGTDLTKALTRESDVKLSAKKVEQITKKIANLGLDAKKTKALTALYKAREQDIKTGRVNGNISFTQAGALYRELMEQKHRNDKGRRVRWSDLTDAERTRIYNKGVDDLRAGAMRLSGSGGGASDQDMLNDLNKFVAGEGNGASLSDELGK